MSVKKYLQSIVFCITSVLTAVLPCMAQDCPSVAAIMVDACGTEQRNEFVIINSGGGFNVNDFQFTFNPTNTSGATNKNVNIGFDSCAVTAGDETIYTGCSNIFSAGPGDVIPANSYVIFQSSNNADEIYDLSSLCEDDKCIYVISNACVRTQGAFTNKSTGSPGPRQNFLSIAGTSCVDEATYSTIDLISGSNGNYFIPPNIYGVNLPDRCVAPPVPDLPPQLPTFDFETSLCALNTTGFALPNTSLEGIQGNWTPSFDTALSQSYTFNPNPGECAQQVAVFINVEAPNTPGFNLPAQLCAGESIALPNTSLEGFTGSWSPDFNPNQTEIYTFTPDNNQCVSKIELQIEIVSEVLPVFDVPLEICQGESFDFPIVSLNGIEGSWSPVFNNQVTTNYTFTPKAGECALPFETSIEIKPLITPEFDLPVSVCAIDNFTLPNSSNNGIEGSWLPNNQPSTSGTYVFTPNPSECAAVVPFEIEVLPEGTPDFNLPATVCFNGVVELPNTSINGYQGVWSPAFNPSQTTTYTFTPDDGQCTNQIFVTTIEVLNFAFNSNLEPLEVCDLDNDGFADFDLEGVTGNVTFNNPNLEVSFHVTNTDANNYVNPLQSPYTNTNPGQQTLFVRIENVQNNCVQTTPLDVVVYNAAVLNNLDPLITCDTDGTDSQVFNLTQIETNILQSGSDTTGVIISYHLSEAGANSNGDMIDNPTAFQNSVNPQTLFIRVTDTASPLECFSVVPLELIVNQQPAINAPGVLASCDDAESGSTTDGIATFDLTGKISEITNNNNDLTVVFYESEADQLNNNAITNLDNYQNNSNPQTLEVSVFNPDTDCVAHTTLTLAVDALPIIEPPQPLVNCSTSGAGISEFDLQAAVAIILNGDLNLQITLHLTESEAVSNLNALVIEAINGASVPFQNTVPFNQTIYTRVQNINNANSNGTDCFSVYPLELQVVEPPVVEELQNLVICDDTTLDGFATFNLTQNTTLAIGSQSAQNITVSYHLTQNDAELGLNPIVNPDNFTNTTNLQTIYVRLFDSVTGCANINGFGADNSFTITVEPYPVLNTMAPLQVCDTQANPNADFPTGVFDLTSQEEALLGLTLVPGNIRFTYYESEIDLLNQQNPIQNPDQFVNTTATPVLIYVEVLNTATANQCGNTATISLEVLPLPTPVELTQEQRRLTSCDNDNDGIAAEPFDLTLIGQQIIGNQNYVATYYLSETAAINQDNNQQILNPEAYINDPALNELDDNLLPTNTQVIWLRLDSILTGNLCFVTVPMEIVVQPNPVLNPLGSPFGYALCEDNPTQLGNPQDVAFNLYDATNGSPSNIISILDPANQVQNPADYSYSFHLSEAEAESGINPITTGYQVTNGETLYLRVTNINTLCYNTGNIAEVIISIEPRPVISNTVLSPLVICADENGEATIDLTVRDADIDPNSNNPGSSSVVIYYAGEDHFNDGIAIPDPNNFNTSTTPIIIFAEVIDLTNTCSSLTVQQFEIQTIPIPIVDISPWDSAVICIDPQTESVITTDVSPPVIDTQLSEDLYSFEWTLNGVPLAFSGSAYTAVQAGQYTVTVSDLNHLAGCTATDSVQIFESNPPQFEVNVLSNAFDGNHSIEVINIQGNGTYEFSVNDGPWQGLENGDNSFVFNGLSGGENIVKGREVDGCGEFVVRVTLIDYPLFFTPNGDGYKEYWNITGLSNQNQARIYIFDRYGKLLKELRPGGTGWDGTYNGNLMPTNDYWFKIEYFEPSTGVGKEFKAHFTLKR